MRTLASLNREYEINTKSADFALLATVMAQAPGNMKAAATLADAAGNISDRVRAVLKTAVAAGSTSGATWAGPLSVYSQLQSGFIQSLATRSVFDAAVSSMLPVKIRTNLVIAAGGSASVVSEGNPAPVTSLSLARGVVDPVAAVALVVITEELARLGLNAAPLIEHELRRVVASKTDLQFMTDLISTLTPIPSSGQQPYNFLADLRALLNAVTSGDDAAFFLAVSPAIAKQLATAATMGGQPAFESLGVDGGSIGGVTVIPTNAATSGQMILFDAAQFGGDVGTVTVDAINEGSIQMSTTPSQPAALVSLFQTNCVGIRCMREFGYVIGRAGAAAMISGASYDDAQSGV